MAEIIDLTTLEIPDCDTCADPTKYKCGKSFDANGPGSVSAVYRCGNVKCKRRKDRIMYYILRRSENE